MKRPMIGLMGAVAPLLLGAAPPSTTTAHWLTAYVSPQMPASAKPDAGDDTVRQIIRFEAAGTQIRLFVGNEGGKAPLRAQDMSIALLDSQGRIRPDSVRRVTFGAARDGISLAPGASMYSDPISLSVARGDSAVVSTYFPPNSGAPDALVKEGYRVAGNHSGDATLPAGSIGKGVLGIVERVEVMPTTARAVVVAIGDSITAGTGSTRLAHKSYPEQLSDRFAALPGGAEWSVVNAGIGGNRVLHDGNGPSLVKRFAHDALDVSGVKAVVVLEGVNDIGHPAAANNADNPQPVTADQLIAAYRSLIAQAHARGVRIYFATILPYAAAAYFSPTGEAIRQRVNTWIRTNQEADGVVEFARPMFDPGSAPPRIKPALSGNGDPHGPGGLHPNDAGYRVMAAQISPADLAR
ncbi:MAG: SGNH/GDSL hydrolase family protein [Sphingomonas sp.]